MDTHNVETGADAKVELKDLIVMDMTDGQRLEFEVVAILKDEESGDEFAVLHGVTDDQFAVTDANGKLLDDTELAQEVLDDFFVLAEESTKEEG